jgi:hypothetical protein
MTLPASSTVNPRLQGISDQVKGLPGRIKVWTQEQSTRRSQRALTSEEEANPLYLLAAVTLGIPALLLIPLVGMNPDVQDGTFTTIMTFLVVSAFVTAVVFEIKRLADQPSDKGQH